MTEQPNSADQETPTGGISRRTIFAGAAGSAALLAGFGGGYAVGHSHQTTDLSAAPEVPFRGEHQPGITTPAQQQMLMVAFNMTAGRVEDLKKLLSDWTLAAERLQAGDTVGSLTVSDQAPPADTGEAIGLGAGSLSVTFGFGAGLFDHPEKGDRFGLADKLPSLLRDGIPRMAAEKLDPRRGTADLVIQICSEDPMVVLHAMHQFKRIAFGLASVQWMQLGYGRTSSTSTEQETPRNLFGFKDGTANIKAEESAAELAEHLWIQPDDEGGRWFAGGTYLCFRKIHMMMEVWDELSLAEQERIIGRDKLEGAPKSGGKEFDDPDFAKAADDGTTLIDPRSHLAVVHPVHNQGRRMLRRGYNYSEGLTELGRLNAGLFFIAFVRNPKTNFIPILARMANDDLTEYLQHEASALFLIPPGVKDGETMVGEAMFR